MAIDQADPKKTPQPRALKLEAEALVALAGTLFSALLLVLTAANAGPLWRDEVNTINVAQMPSLGDLWHNMPFESFPPLWPLILRGCTFLGLAGSDAGIRVLGLYVGICVLISLWLSARWMGSRAPILSIGLLGSLPAFIFIMGANRAYGLATCLLVLSFGTLWRMVEHPTRGRILAAGVTCFLFAHCVYYDAVFLAAMLAGGAAVTLRRRQWKTLGALTGIGVVSAVSLALYLPIIHRGTPYVPLMQWPTFSFLTLSSKLRETVTACSSGELAHVGREIWLWVALILAGTVSALLAQRRRAPVSSAQVTGEQPGECLRADLALFCVVSLLTGVPAFLAFLYRLHYWTQSWYYIELLCLCGLALDGLLGANWPKLRPWGLLRIGLMLAMTGWYVKAGWEEAHTRRSNMDLIAAVLKENAADTDLIVVQTAFEGITFNRYYHGRAPWVTVPPVDSHLVHRSDLVLARMNQPESLAPVLQAITNTLQNGHSVWLLGNMSNVRLNSVPSDLPATWLGTYLIYWSSQISTTLLDHALQEKIVDIPAGCPVSCQENVPMARFSGYRVTSTNSVVAEH